MTLSSTEEEYVATTTAGCQNVWMKRTLYELQHEQNEPTPFFVTINQILHYQEITSFIKEVSILIQCIILSEN